LAQRNGPVTSHIRVANAASELHSTRIAAGGADLILGSDIVVTSGVDTLSKIRLGRTRLVVNSHVAPTFAFATNPDMDFSSAQMLALLRDAAGEDNAAFVAATELATALMANAVAANLFLVGYALQCGLLPVSLEALERAIELNGVEEQMNKASLAWGRLAADDLAAVEIAASGSPDADVIKPVDTVDSVMAHRSAFLTNYQNAAYAARYRRLVDRSVEAEARVLGASGPLSLAVAKYYFKLLAYKDEYEVARLYAEGDFLQQIKRDFEGGFKIEFNMAPPLLTRRDAQTGRHRKRVFGGWMLPAMGLLAKLRFLRGTVLDVFGWAQHRRAERALILEYEATLARLLEGLTRANHPLAVEIARLPESIRGYDTVKDASIQLARAEQHRLLREWETGAAQAAA
jgi:indolepyruvate ferredoxin oxidoreductase